MWFETLLKTVQAGCTTNVSRKCVPGAWTSDQECTITHPHPCPRDVKVRLSAERRRDIDVLFVVRTSAVDWCWRFCRCWSRLSLWRGAIQTISIVTNWCCTMSQHSVKCGGWYTRPDGIITVEFYQPRRTVSCYVSIYIFFARYMLVRSIHKMAMSQKGVSQCVCISLMSVTQ